MPKTRDKYRTNSIFFIVKNVLRENNLQGNVVRQVGTVIILFNFIHLNGKILGWSRSSIKFLVDIYFLRFRTRTTSTESKKSSIMPTCCDRFYGSYVGWCRHHTDAHGQDVNYSNSTGYFWCNDCSGRGGNRGKRFSDFSNLLTHLEARHSFFPECFDCADDSEA